MGKFIIGAIVLGFAYFLFLSPASSKSFESSNFIYEQYEQEQARFTNANGQTIKFGLYFISDTEVDFLNDGVKTGPTMSYSISGSEMTVEHHCGTDIYDILDGGNTLHNRKLNWSASKL